MVSCSAANARGWLTWALLSTAVAAAWPAVAQSPSPLAVLAEDASPARGERLKEGARSEGTVTIYASGPVEDLKPIFDAFEAKHGVKVRHWRAGPEDILQRSVTEARAGRHEADVYETNGPTMEAMRREGLFQATRSAVHADLLPAAVPAHREWVGDRLNIIVGAWNTGAFRPADIPSSYQGFLDQRFKGKLAVERDDHDWLATIARGAGEERTIKLFQDIAAANGIAPRNGHTLLANLVAAGEVPYALTVFSYKAEQLKAKGAPIELNIIKPAVARIGAIAVSRRAPHHHAALLLYEFMLTDAQQMFMDRDFWPTNRRLKDVPGDLGLVFVDSAQMVDEGDKWTRVLKGITATRPK